MSIEMVKIRAKISIGYFSVETPFILSFNVRKARGQVSTFDASIKVLAGTSNLVGGPIEIEAGTEGNEKLIFTGTVKKATISPCYDDPQYVIINTNGEDILGFLVGKKFTRRCKASKSSWVSITGVTRKGLKSGKFTYKKEDTLWMSDAEIDEGTAVTRAMSMADLGPWNKINKVEADKSIDKINLEAIPVVEGEGSF